MKKITLIPLLIFIAQFNMAYAADKTYSGNGISFNYRGNYQLKENTIKGGNRVYLKTKGNNISITIYNKTLDPGFPKAVTVGLKKRYEKTGYRDIVIKKKNDKMAFGVKGKSGKMKMNVIKVKLKCIATEKGVDVKLEQYILFFSHGSRGFYIVFTRTSAPGSDFEKVLKTLTLEE